MKLTVNLLRLPLLAAIFVGAACAQQPAPEQNKEANLKANLELLRKDVKKDKVTIVTELMDLTPDDAAKFWPVYNEYDKALTALADERLKLIRMYAENYGSVTSDVATKLANGTFDLDTKRIAVRRQYFSKMSQVLSPKQAARFIQIENNLEKIIDLQIASTLPIIE